MPQITVKFKFERETVNKIRFTEDTEDTEVIGKLYLTKEACKALGTPKTLTVVVEA